MIVWAIKCNLQHTVNATISKRCEVGFVNKCGIGFWGSELQASIYRVHSWLGTNLSLLLRIQSLLHGLLSELLFLPFLELFELWNICPVRSHVSSNLNNIFRVVHKNSCMVDFSSSTHWGRQPMPDRTYATELSRNFFAQPCNLLRRCLHDSTIYPAT